MAASCLWTVCSCKTPERPREDEECLRKRLGKAPDIYRARGIVQVWRLSALSISNCDQPSGKQTGYSPYHRLQRNVRWTCCNPQGWTSTDRVSYIMWPSAKLHRAASICAAFCRPLSNTGTRMGQAESLGVSHHWSLVPALTLDPSLTDKSCNILPLCPHPCHQADDVKGRRKHWERFETMQLCFVTFWTGFRTSTAEGWYKALSLL